jgi:hypothetical protein
VNRNFPSLLAASRTRSSPFGLLSRPCVRPRLGWSVFSLVSVLPSTTSSGDLPLLFGCFAGTIPLYDSPPPYMWDLWLIAFSHRPAVFPPRTVTGPLGSRAWSFYACVGSSTPQGRAALALSHIAFLRSGCLDTVRSLIRRFRSSISRLHIPLSNASSAASRPPSHGSGPGWFAIPCLYDFFHHCSMPVYPDAIQDSLLTCLLDFDQAGFTPAG